MTESLFSLVVISGHIFTLYSYLGYLPPCCLMILDNFGGFCLKVGIQYESILYFMLRNLAAVCGSTGCNSFCTRVFVMISYITNTSLVLQGYVLIMYAICFIQYKSEKHSEHLLLR